MHLAVTFPLPPSGDHFPGLAVEDGRLGEVAARALDLDAGADALLFLVEHLWPNRTDRQ